MTRTDLALAAAALTLAAAGCSSTPEFRPVEAEESAPGEYAGAYYELDRDGVQAGDVKVWTRGLQPPAGADKGPPWRVHVALRLRNDGQAPLRLDLDGTELEVQTDGDGGGVHVVDEPAEVDGPLEVAPGTIERVHLLYELPAAVDDADEVLGLELVWSVSSSELRFSRSTPFRRERRAGLGQGARSYYYRPWTYEPWAGSTDPYRRPFLPYD